jgi:extracellular factor (EF) 3-hydroxypalmitic acid methyl ester biosynthesis protein
MLDEIRTCLDRAASELQAHNYRAAFSFLGEPLSELHDRATARGQSEEARQFIQAHAVFGLCQEDPYTHRARTKPRGYAGDAVMLDYVYHGAAPPGTSRLGSGIFGQTTRGPMGLSVVFRRALLTALINDVVARNPSANILSVASGHCREVDGSFVQCDSFNGSFIAFDQDEDSCAEVAATYGRWVRPQVGSVRRLLAGGYDLGRFDLIYSAGLYDYLPAAVARQLTNRLCAMLCDGGRFLTANFAQGSHGRGYMDWLMEWQLEYRSSEEFQGISAPEGAAVSTFIDPHENVVYATYRHALG